MDDLQYLETQLRALASSDGDFRVDARFTGIIDKQLEFVKSRTYDILYPKLKSRLLIPVSNEVNTGAKTITYRQYDGFGAAQVIANYADDFPMVDVGVEEFISKVHGIAAAYQWTIEDLRASAMAGAMLDTRRAARARDAIEKKLEDVAAYGLPKGGLFGFYNQPNVPLIGTVNGAWATPATTPLEIIADLNALVNSIVVSSQETFIPDTLVLDTEGFNIISSRHVSLDGNADKTILRYFLDNNPYITNIESWFKGKAGDAALTGERMVAYQRSPDVLTLEHPQEFETFPPQARNLAFIVNNHASTGGVIVYYPIGMAYMDSYL